MLGLWFESARAMFFLFILLNALPVPMLRQVSVSVVFFVLFPRRFWRRLFPCFFQFWGAFGGAWGGHFLTFFVNKIVFS